MANNLSIHIALYYIEPVEIVRNCGCDKSNIIIIISIYTILPKYWVTPLNGERTEQQHLSSHTDHSKCFTLEPHSPNHILKHTQHEVKCLAQGHIWMLQEEAEIKPTIIRLQDDHSFQYATVTKSMDSGVLITSMAAVYTVWSSESLLACTQS
ncbi:hypothetical protein ILYODFUR_037046 [Ilyodon furcidens]|uniref:Uncharacterized protein n=1 Tax=Ilyodon furcidens TaxID=33524 RepID=A0ABV0VKN7_9TELE